MALINTCSPMSSHKLPKCSLIVATYNWPEALEKCLKSVFKQTHLPHEILVADDGSGSLTRDLLERLKEISPVPLRHIWHEDKGFRLSEIRNKAIYAAEYEYIIQIDGDILIDKHFIKDHLEMAEPNAFLCGSRVLLPQELSKKILYKPGFTWSRLRLPLGYVLNSIRFPALGRYLSDRYKKGQLTVLRGCNMSFWKEDLLQINGYNNDITGWGSEDAELAIRLHNLGNKKRFLKFLGIAYHLYHPENDKSKLGQNQIVQNRALNEKTIRISNGIRQDDQTN